MFRIIGIFFVVYFGVLMMPVIFGMCLGYFKQTMQIFYEFLLKINFINKIPRPVANHIVHNLTNKKKIIRVLIVQIEHCC